MEEIWKNIDGFENYQISNLGRVRNNKFNGKIKTLTKKKNGYVVVGLCENGKFNTYRVHRLVAIAFLPNPNNYPEVNHKDENKENNFVWVNEDGTVDPEKSNLEWCSRNYNSNYGTGIERHREKMKGKRHRGGPKPVFQIKDGTIIQKWNSMLQAEKAKIATQSQIWRCCNNIQKTAGGFSWQYAYNEP